MLKNLNRLTTNVHYNKVFDLLKVNTFYAIKNTLQNYILKRNFAKMGTNQKSLQVNNQNGSEH